MLDTEHAEDSFWHVLLTTKDISYVGEAIDEFVFTITHQN